MTLRTLHQSFPSTGITPSKVELFLRKVEASTPSGIPLSKTSDAVIDAPNFAYMNSTKPRTALFQQGVLNGQTGSGYMGWTASGTSVSYPIEPTNDGSYNVWIRIRSSISSVFVKMFVDDTLAVTVACTSLNSVTWSWFSGSVVFPDTTVHSLSLSPQSACDIDKIVITRSTTPTGTGPDFTDPTYCTVHAKLWPDNADIPYLSPESYDGISTYTHIVKSDWYTFDFNPIYPISPIGEMGVVVNVSGSSASRNIVWEEANTFTHPSASKTGYGSFVADDAHSLTLRVYNSQSSLAGGANSTPDATIITDVIDDFDSTTSPIFDNTILTTDEYDGSGNDVQLDVSNKLISLLIDQSGSQTWNDSDNVRLTAVRDILDTLEGRYPATIRFNLFKIKGEKSFSIFVPLTSKPDSLDISDIVKAAFVGDPQDFAGFRVIRKEGSYSTTPIDGEIVSDGYMLAALDTELITGTQYYYTVYTYDQLYRFSKGIQLNIQAAPKTLPRGIPSFSDEVFVGYGPIRDNNTVALWHTDEGSGNYVFDFSDSNIPLTALNVRWLDQTDSPIGQFGVRLNGLNSQLNSTVSSKLAFTQSQPFTVIFTVMPLDGTSVSPIICRSTASHFNWGIGCDNAKIRFYTGAGTSVVTSGSLNVGEWNTVGVVYNGSLSVNIYINGSLDSSHAVPSSTWDVTNAAINIGHDPSGIIANYFFGKLTHISVHNVARSSTYISNAVQQNKDLQDQSTADNGDRLVVLTWNIPSDYNFVGGNYRVVMNRQQIPSHENDGQIVLSGAASFGTFVQEVPQNYDVNHTYFFRLFSQNILGNWSAIEDSAALSTFIPDIVRHSVQITTDSGNTILQPAGPGFGSFAPPTVTIAKAGNAKVWLHWTVPNDPQISRVVVYSSTDRFPYYDNTTQDIVGDIVWDGISSISDFVHRDLTNLGTQYYAVVTKDKYNHFSSLITADSHGNALRFVPQNSLDDTGIPLLEVLNVRYHIMDSDQIEIGWDSPVVFKSSLDGYFDDEFFLYAAICDLYGNPLNIDFPSGFNITATVGNTATTAVEDAFGLGTSATQISSLPNATFSVASNIASGTIRLRNGGPLAILESISINLTASYQINSNFTYNLPNLTVTFNNPLSLQIINRDSQYLPVSDFGNFNCLVDAYSGNPTLTNDQRKSVNGCYVQRKAPLPVRAQFTYKGNPIPNPSLQVRILDDINRNSVDVNPCGLTPKLAVNSTLVKLVNPTLTTAVEQIQILDSLGMPTGSIQSASFTDMLVIPSQLPQSAAVFVLVTNQGYNIVRKINLFFANILKISTSLFAPNPDGLDVREEFARVWLIDPDSPNNSGLISVAPDLSIVRWDIAAEETGTVNVPFYSTDNVPLGNGIYSYTRRGTARNVFFGPAGNGAAGHYDITVSTTVNNLFASVTGTVLIQGVTGDTFHKPIPDPDAPRIYCELDEAAESVYADGVEYIKMRIYRNVLTATPITNTTPHQPVPEFVTCFQNCSNVFVPLNVGQTVHIDAQGWSIISGSVIENLDGTIDVTNALIFQDASDVKLIRGDFTPVWFRTNRVIPRANDVCVDITGGNQCSCPLPIQICGATTAVLVSTKINYNGKPLVIYGGGALNDGRPPTVLGAREPLHIDFVGIQANGQQVSDIIVDGTTQNVIVSEVTWKGGTVPDGTPVQVDITASQNALGKSIKDVVSFPTIAYVHNINDPLINPTGATRSFAKFVIPALPTTTSFAVGFVFTATYNAVGNTVRQQQYGIKFTYVIQQPLIAGPPSPAITSRLDRFDVIGETWSSQASMIHPRAAFSLTLYQDHLFAVSGTDGSQLLFSTERYDIATNTWYEVAPISVARMYAQTAVIGQYLYVIGGLTSDPAGNLSITPAVERYDMVNNVWTRLSDMPANYAIVLGTTATYSGTIKVISGYAGTFNTYNNVVLTYDPVGNTWTKSVAFTGDNLGLYSRLGAFGFQKGNVSYAVDGLYYLPPTPATDNFPGQPEVRIYLGDAYSYDFSTNTLAAASQSFTDLPHARFLGQTVEIGNVAYFIGGTNTDSNTLRYLESETIISTPFAYAAFAKMENGRSSFGAAGEPVDAYGEAIWVAGGVTNRRDSNFLRVTVDAVPQQVGLDGIQTGAVNITVQDENGDSPSSVLVRVTGSAGTDYDPVIFTEDNITVVNGFAVATLMPRSDDPPTALLGEGASFTTYAVGVSAAILDDTFVGETDAITTSNSTGSINPNSNTPSIIISVDPLYVLNTVVQRDFAQGGAVLTINNINNIISLNPTEANGGTSAEITYQARINWLPQVENLIDDNEGTFDDVRAFLDRMDVEVPFGGTPILDGLNAAASIMTLDSTSDRKMAFVVTDGIDNDSNATLATVQSSFNGISGSLSSPIIAAIFKVVPSTMHLDKGVRQPSTVMDQITSITGGSDKYITSDLNISDTVRSIISAPGFIGAGSYECIIDLGDTVLINSIVGNFELLDSDTDAQWRFAVAGIDLQFGDFSDYQSANTTLSLTDTVARYIKIEAILLAQLSIFVYGESKLIPPVLENFTIVFNKPTTSYIFINSDISDDEVSQISFSMDVNRPQGSEVEFGYSSFKGTSFEDYTTEQQSDNGSRIIVPIRRSLDVGKTSTLESLSSIDGFLFESAYGPWAPDATVAIYDNGITLVDLSSYQVFPDMGYVVFATKTTSSFVISITSQPSVNLAVKVTNRIAGQPVVIHGAGYMYSTLKQKNSSTTKSILLPQSLNLMVIPITPNPTSTFDAEYTYYDLSGGIEQGTQINWFVNGQIKTDLNNLAEWDNTFWNFAVAGDQIYFTVTPSNGTYTGATVRSLPVTVMA